MKKFKVSAKFKMGKQHATLNKDITARDEDHAKELIMCLLGSKHGTPRRLINILNIAETSDVSVVLDESE